jgi:hypothetical protein
MPSLVFTTQVKLLQMSEHADIKPQNMLQDLHSYSILTPTLNVCEFKENFAEGGFFGFLTSYLQDRL